MCYAPRFARPEGRPLLFTAKVEGVQIYRCEGVDPNIWTYQATEVKLLGEQTQNIGVHTFKSGKGTWTARDGSSVSGDIIQREKAPSVENAPWLLIAVRARREAGLLARVESVRQIETVGGNPKVLYCTQMEAEMRVPFSAIHQFYGVGENE